MASGSLASHFHSHHRFISELREEAIKAQKFVKDEEISLFFPSQRITYQCLEWLVNTHCSWQHRQHICHNHVRSSWHLMNMLSPMLSVLGFIYPKKSSWWVSLSSQTTNKGIGTRELKYIVQSHPTSNDGPRILTQHLALEFHLTNSLQPISGFNFLGWTWYRWRADQS